jgi:hypothetical protein
VAVAPENRERRRQYQREWYERNKERVRTEQQAYQQEHREELRAYWRDYYQTHKKEAHARYKAKKARRQNELIAPAECSACGGGGGRIVAHHPDYDQPLLVEWLCDGCHIRRHRGDPAYASAA